MAHAHDHEHQHGAVAFDRSLVEDEVLKELDAVFPPLSEHLSLVAKYPDLDTAEREDAVRLHERVEKDGPFTVGFHAEGDQCAVCEEPTRALFQDQFKNGVQLPWGSFVADLPVHPECAPKFPIAYPRPAPRVIDQARRRYTTDATRPPANVAAFWRHDVVRHGTFNLEHWANALFHENQDQMDRRMVKGVQKLVDYVHDKLFHA